MIDRDGKYFFSQQAFDSPHLIYKAMLEQSPVCQIGDTRAFMVCSHQAVGEAVKRTAEFSSNLDGMLAYLDDGDVEIFDLTGSGAARNVIATADEPDHMIQRRFMMPSLKASKINDMESELRDFSRARVRQFVEQDGGDICGILAEALPAYVVLKILGLNDDAQPAIQRWAMTGGDFLAGRFHGDDITNILKQSGDMSNYMAACFDEVNAKPPGERGESLIALLSVGVNDGLISREQAIGILVILFGAAGESTASLLGSSIRLLAENPALQSELRANPALIPAFIEETVRLESPFKFHYRIVREPAQLCGIDLQEGDLLLLGWAAANRDPAVWEKPDEIILDRPKRLRHFGFGFGSHFCIGAPLARMEVRVALEELLAGTSHFKLDDEKPYEFCPSIMVRRALHLHLLLS